MAECKPYDVVGCVAATPSLGFGVFNNISVIFAGLWIWFLSVQGLMRWTESNGVFDLFSNFFAGGKVLVGNVPVNTTTISQGVNSASYRDIVLSLVVAGLTIGAGIYFAETELVGPGSIMLLVLAVALIYSSPLNQAMALPVAGGIIIGTTVNVLMWLYSSFSIDSGNEVGGSVMLLWVLWVLFTFMVVYGSRITSSGRPPPSLLPKKQTKTKTVKSVSFK